MPVKGCQNMGIEKTAAQTERRELDCLWLLLSLL